MNCDVVPDLLLKMFRLVDFHSPPSHNRHAFLTNNNILCPFSLYFFSIKYNNAIIPF